MHATDPAHSAAHCAGVMASMQLLSLPLEHAVRSEVPHLVPWPTSVACVAAPPVVHSALAHVAQAPLAVLLLPSKYWPSLHAGYLAQL